MGVGPAAARRKTDKALDGDISGSAQIKGRKGEGQTTQSRVEWVGEVLAVYGSYLPTSRPSRSSSRQAKRVGKECRVNKCRVALPSHRRQPPSALALIPLSRRRH